MSFNKNKGTQNEIYTFSNKKIYDSSLYRSKPRRNEEQEEEVNNSDKHLGYFTRFKQNVCLTVPIDEGFQEAKYYRAVAKAIADTSEGDQIEFEISSPGGLLNGLLALLTSMAKTDATTVAHINGECHSAASMLALNCDAIYVSPYATMLVHFLQFGAAGKATDVRSQVEHIYETSQKLFRETYEHFLTSDEIQKCIDGLELWLSAEDINKRLERKFNIMQKLQEEEQSQVQSKPRKSKKIKIEDTNAG